MDIPRRAWEGWIEPGKPRRLRRALTVDERDLLQIRKNELEAWIGGYHEAERSKVVTALSEMFLGFTSTDRIADTDAAAKIASELEFLRDFPEWAITAACANIRRRGVWRNGAFDKRWPPSDPELRAEIEEEMRFYTESYRNARDMLTAEMAR